MTLCWPENKHGVCIGAIIELTERNNTKPLNGRWSHNPGSRVPRFNPANPSSQFPPDNPTSGKPFNKISRKEPLINRRRRQHVNITNRRSLCGDQSKRSRKTWNCKPRHVCICIYIAVYFASIYRSKSVSEKEMHGCVKLAQARHARVQPTTKGFLPGIISLSHSYEQLKGG